MVCYAFVCSKCVRAFTMYGKLKMHCVRGKNVVHMYECRQTYAHVNLRTQKHMCFFARNVKSKWCVVDIVAKIAWPFWLKYSPDLGKTIFISIRENIQLCVHACTCMCSRVFRGMLAPICINTWKTKRA